MRKSIYLLFGLLIFSLSSVAQNTSIIDDLNTSKPGQGNITIYQDDNISKLLGKKIVSGVATSANFFSQQMNTTGGAGTSSTSKNYVRAKGFRIQVYSGNNQRLSKNEAESRRNTIRSTFPGMDVSVTYNSPTWRVKAGHFQTREQANQALEQMKIHFPSFGREMIIINDEIRIPVE